jgi:hypothetical protein
MSRDARARPGRRGASPGGGGSARLPVRDAEPRGCLDQLPSLSRDRRRARDRRAGRGVAPVVDHGRSVPGPRPERRSSSGRDRKGSAIAARRRHTDPSLEAREEGCPHIPEQVADRDDRVHDVPRSAQPDGPHSGSGRGSHAVRRLSRRGDLRARAAFLRRVLGLPCAPRSARERPPVRVRGEPVVRIVPRPRRQPLAHHEG